MDCNVSDGTRSKNLQRRTSLEKFMHICNQGRQVFPLMFLRFQGFHSSLSAELRQIIPKIKSLLVLQMGVYLSICLLYFELFCCLVFSLTALPSGTNFLLASLICVSVLALQVLHNINLSKILRQTFFVKRKSE